MAAALSKEPTEPSATKHGLWLVCPTDHGTRMTKRSTDPPPLWQIALAIAVIVLIGICGGK